MRLSGRRESRNVEDRRGMRPGRVAAGGGLGMIILIVAALLFGVDPRALLNVAPTTTTQQAPSGDYTGTPHEEDLRQFVSVVLATTEDVWGGIFSQNGQSYRQPTVVLFTDLVGHTEMMRRLGDADGRAVLREHERVTREMLRDFGGEEVKTMGDGFMASFASIVRATDCAIALQRAFGARTGEPLHVRVGLDAGEPIEEDGDLFGSTVILASRIAAGAGAGEILISDELRKVLTKVPKLVACPPMELKNKSQPVKVFKVVN